MLPMWNPLAQVAAGKAVTARESLAPPVPLMIDQVTLTCGGVGSVLGQPLHRLGSSSCREKTRVMMSPLSARPTTLPALFAMVTESGNMIGVVTAAWPSLDVVSVNDAADPMPATVAKTAVATAMTAARL